MRARGDGWTFAPPVYVRAWGSAVGSKEAQGPLGGRFDVIAGDNRFGRPTWEKAETEMISLACRAALDKGDLPPEALDLCLFSAPLAETGAELSAARQALATVKICRDFEGRT